MCNYSLHHSPLISLLDESRFLATELAYFGKCLQGCRRQQGTETLPLPTPDTGLPGGIRKGWAYWQKWGRRGCWRQGETSDLCAPKAAILFFNSEATSLSLFPPGDSPPASCPSLLFQSLLSLPSQFKCLFLWEVFPHCPCPLVLLSFTSGHPPLVLPNTYPSCRTCKSYRPLRCKLQREQWLRLLCSSLHFLCSRQCLEPGGVTVNVS